MRTEDIVTTVERMKARGVEFLDKIPDAYYDRL
jgi:4-hydroxyphenylpyruvate dioxygenase-like putative hemolysin